MTPHLDPAQLVHELAQPLAVLDGYLYALHKSAQLDAEGARCLAAAREASGDLLAIIDRVARHIAEASERRGDERADPPG